MSNSSTPRRVMASDSSTLSVSGKGVEADTGAL